MIGNFPSSFQKQTNDELYQFCHGATGAIPTLILSYELF